MGLAVGLAAGVAAGLLAAPMRGSDMRASLRTRADRLRERRMRRTEEARQAFSRSQAPETPAALTATIGEIAQTHPGAKPFTEAQP
jgi:gas vesicle protein